MSRKRKSENAPAPDRGTTPAGTEGAASGGKESRKHRRAKGCGGLILRGNVYQARWIVNGKVYVRSTKTDKKREAEKKLQEFTAEFRTKDEERIVENLSARVRGVRAEIERYEDGKPALLTIAAWQAYEKSQNRPDTGADTMRMYESQFGRLQDWIKEKHPEATELRNISQGIADEFAEYIGAKFSANTFNKYRALFICIWDVLRDTARLTVNPWKSIRRKVQVGHTRRELTVEELGRIYKRTAGEMRTLFFVGIYTGLRLRDCALLEWGSIDLARRFISLIPHKIMRHANGKPVRIPILPLLAGVLSETPEDRRTGYVMPEIAAAYLKDTSLLSDRIQQVFADCGIRTQAEKLSEGERAKVEVGFHSLRHTFVSIAENAGVPLAIVQAIVGHSNPAMMRHYFHVSDTALTTAVAALPDITAENPRKLPAETDHLIRAFREIVGQMDAAQLKTAQKILTKLCKRI